MYIFTLILGVIGILCCCAIAEIHEQNDVISSQTDGIKEAPLLDSLLPIEEPYQEDIEQYSFPIEDSSKFPEKRRCPLCDSSVYPYCGEKLLHDACCCTNAYIQHLPQQCKLADCRFLHANTCREHRLIALCCCSDDYRSLLKNLSNV